MVDGVTGVLVDPGDVEGQARVLVDLSEDRRRLQSLGDAGRYRILKNFTVEQEAEALRAIFAQTDPL